MGAIRGRRRCSECLRLIASACCLFEVECLCSLGSTGKFLSMFESVMIGRVLSFGWTSRRRGACGGSRDVCFWCVDIFFQDVFGRDEWPLLDVFVPKR